MKKIRAGRENSALAEGAQIRAFHRKSPFGAFGMGHAQGPRPDIVFPAYAGVILTPNWSEKDIENALHLTLNQPHVAFASGSWRILRRDVGGIVFEARYSYSKKKQKSVLRHFHPIAGEEVIIYRKEIIEKGITSLRWLLHDFKP